MIYKSAYSGAVIDELLEKAKSLPVSNDDSWYTLNSSTDTDRILNIAGLVKAGNYKFHGKIKYPAMQAMYKNHSSDLPQETVSEDMNVFIFVQYDENNNMYQVINENIMGAECMIIVWTKQTDNSYTPMYYYTSDMSSSGLSFASENSETEDAVDKSIQLNKKTGQLEYYDSVSDSYNTIDTTVIDIAKYDNNNWQLGESGNWLYQNGLSKDDSLSVYENITEILTEPNGDDRINYLDQFYLGYLYWDNKYYFNESPNQSFDDHFNIANVSFNDFEAPWSSYSNYIAYGNGVYIVVPYKGGEIYQGTFINDTIESELLLTINIDNIDSANLRCGTVLYANNFFYILFSTDTEVYIIRLDNIKKEYTIIYQFETIYSTNVKLSYANNLFFMNTSFMLIDSPDSIDYNIVYSTDCINWTNIKNVDVQIKLPDDEDAICDFFGVNSIEEYLDDIIWYSLTGGYEMSNIAYGNGVYACILSTYGTNHDMSMIMISNDAVHWEIRDISYEAFFHWEFLPNDTSMISEVEYTWRTIDFCNDYFIMVSGSLEIAYSKDCIIWNIIKYDSPDIIVEIDGTYYINGYYVIVVRYNEYGVCILYSPNLTNFYLYKNEYGHYNTMGPIQINNSLYLAKKSGLLSYTITPRHLTKAEAEDLNYRYTLDMLKTKMTEISTEILNTEEMLNITSNEEYKTLFTNFYNDKVKPLYDKAYSHYYSSHTYISTWNNLNLSYSVKDHIHNELDITINVDSITGTFTNDNVTVPELTWEENGSSFGDRMFGKVCYGNGVYVSVCFDSKYNYYSTDGINWSSAQNLPSKSYWVDVCYGNGMFILIHGYYSSSYNETTNTYAYSTDGINWTEGTLPSSQQWTSICYGNDKFVIISRGYIHTYAYYSYNGIDWDSCYRSNHDPKYYKYIAYTRSYMTKVYYANGIYLMLSSDPSASEKSKYYCYSYDGIIWETRYELFFKNGCQDICYGNGMFVVLIKSTNTYYVSSDGLNWTSKSFPTHTGYYTNIYFWNNMFIIPESSSLDYIYSYNGIKWYSNKISTDTGYNWLAYEIDSGFIINSNSKKYLCHSTEVNYPILQNAYQHSYQVATEDELLTLTDIHNNDYVVLKNSNGSSGYYVVIDESKLGTMDAFVQLDSPSPDASWESLTQDAEFNIPHYSEDDVDNIIEINTNNISDLETDIAGKKETLDTLNIDNAYDLETLIDAIDAKINYINSIL